MAQTAHCGSNSGSSAAVRVRCSNWMNIIFDTDLSPFMGGKRFTSCFVTSLNATFTPRESGRWLLALQYDSERGERPESFNAERCRELVRIGAGSPDVTADLV